MGKSIANDSRINTYYIIRVFAGLFFMLSFGVGMMAGAQFGKGIGWLTFGLLAAVGLTLHRTARKYKEREELHHAGARAKVK